MQSLTLFAITRSSSMTQRKINAILLVFSQQKNSTSKIERSGKKEKRQSFFQSNKVLS
jgi:hypothetical protein